MRIIRFAHHTIGRSASFDVVDGDGAIAVVCPEVERRAEFGTVVEAVDKSFGHFGSAVDGV